MAKKINKQTKMEKLFDIMKIMDKIILNILKFITVTVFAFITLIVSANVFVRFVPIVSLHWLDEVIEMLFAALVFYGAAAGWITKGHFSVGDWISKFFKSQRVKNFYRLIIEIMVLGFVVLFLYYSFLLFIRTHDVTNALAIPKKILYLCLPISGIIMITYSIKNVLFELIGVIKPEAVKEVLEKKKS